MQAGMYELTAGQNMFGRKVCVCVCGVETKKKVLAQMQAYECRLSYVAPREKFPVVHAEPTVEHFIYINYITDNSV